MSSPLIREDHQAVTRITLNSPENLNALSEELLTALQSELDDLATNNEIRAVVIAGAGRAFCAGHDLREIALARQSPDQGQAFYEMLFEKCSKMMMSIRNLPQPVIAEVHGIATAAGCQLVATCDMAIAAEGTKFGVNGIDLGLFCMTPSVALSRNISRKRAFELLSTGGFAGAPEARDLGLINRVVQAHYLRSETDQLAQVVASKFGKNLAKGKQVFYEQLLMSEAEAYALTSDAMVNALMVDQTADAIKAFVDKTDHTWDQ